MVSGLGIKGAGLPFLRWDGLWLTTAKVSIFYCKIGKNSSLSKSTVSNIVRKIQGVWRNLVKAKNYNLTWTGGDLWPLEQHYMRNHHAAMISGRNHTDFRVHAVGRHCLHTRYNHVTDTLLLSVEILSSLDLSSSQMDRKMVDTCSVIRWVWSDIWFYVPKLLKAIHAAIRERCKIQHLWWYGGAVELYRGSKIDFDKRSWENLTLCLCFWWHILFRLQSESTSVWWYPWNDNTLSQRINFRGPNYHQIPLGSVSKLIGHSFICNFWPFLILIKSLISAKSVAHTIK